MKYEEIKKGYTYLLKSGEEILIDCFLGVEYVQYYDDYGKKHMVNRNNILKKVDGK